MSVQTIVIVGAGHAGVQAAASLREEGFDGEITLLCDEPDLPYQRPPLSKAFLKGQMDLAGLPLRGEKFFDEHRIDLRLGVAVARIDRAGRRVEFAHGGDEPYDHLILATGARARRAARPRPRPRRRPRAARDSRRGGDQAAGWPRRAASSSSAPASSASRSPRPRAALGGEVTIVEIADRPMGRAVSPAMSAFFLDAHRGFGATFELGHRRRGAARRGRPRRRGGTVRRPPPAGRSRHRRRRRHRRGRARARGRASTAPTASWSTRELVTSDPAISAIGDCAASRMPASARSCGWNRCRTRPIRPNASPAGSPASPRPMIRSPWFWSDQGDLKLQIAGLSHGVDHWVTRGDPAGARLRRVRLSRRQAGGRSRPSTAAATTWPRAAFSPRERRSRRRRRRRKRRSAEAGAGEIAARFRRAYPRAAPPPPPPASSSRRGGTARRVPG